MYPNYQFDDPGLKKRFSRAVGVTVLGVTAAIGGLGVWVYWNWKPPKEDPFVVAPPVADSYPVSPEAWRSLSLELGQKPSSLDRLDPDLVPKSLRQPGLVAVLGERRPG